MAETFLSIVYHAFGAWGRTVQADAEDAARQPAEIAPTLILEPMQIVGETPLVPSIGSITIKQEYGAITITIPKALREKINNRIYRFKSEGCIVSHEEQIYKELQEANPQLTDEQLNAAFNQLKKLCYKEPANYRA